MKTKIEVMGFEIELEEVDGKLIIEIERDEEVIEELTLDPSDYEGKSGEEEDMDESDIKAFDEFSDDSESLPSEEGDVDGDVDGDDVDDDTDEDDKALESFSSWTKNK